MPSTVWPRRPAEFRWPPRPTFSFYNSRGEFLFRERDANLDLSDTLMLHWNRPTRLVYVGIRSRGSWKTWTEKRLRHVESHMTYDLNFDGDDVAIQRVTPGFRTPCTSEFRWRLRIRSM